MRTSLALALSVAGLAVAAPRRHLEERQSSGLQGFDISHYQTTVDFSGAYSSGVRFVIFKVIFHCRQVAKCLLIIK